MELGYIESIEIVVRIEFGFYGTILCDVNSEVCEIFSRRGCSNRKASVSKNIMILLVEKTNITNGYTTRKSLSLMKTKNVDVCDEMFKN